jgi:hypothetical protein
MSVAFWSAEIKTTTPVEVQPPEGYVLNVTLAALTGNGKGAQIIKVKTSSIDGEDVEAAIGTLRFNQTEQMNFALIFGYDVPVTFSLVGDAQAKVYLTGIIYNICFSLSNVLKFILINRILSTCSRIWRFFLCIHNVCK